MASSALISNLLMQTSTSAQEATLRSPATQTSSEIVVIARRVSESLSKVPVAVSAFNSDQLTERAVPAALDSGLTTVDASLCGIGGCPFAPGASGNIVTEDLAFMLEARGFRTGIDLDRLLKVREIPAEALPGEPLYGFIADAGLPLGSRSARQRETA